MNLSIKVIVSGQRPKLLAFRRLCGVLLVALGVFAYAGEWSGNVASETRLFLENPLDEQQCGDNLSLSFEPEYYHEWIEQRTSVTFKPFFRVDQHDSERTHADLRELSWEKAAETWELRIGVRKVFWGVTESQHLVDIINQTDLVENIDGEEKLGQPMVNLALIQNWGTLDFFVLPIFRERTFPGEQGRFRPPLPIDSNHAAYESSAEELHTDWAIRWSHHIGDWDIGVSHFNGTSREPRFLVKSDPLKSPELVPYYDQIHQTGMDLQLTKGRWLWKFETIVRSGQGETFNALTGGFECTFYQIFDTGADIGLLAEYLYDSRGKQSPSPFENDLFAGIRIGLNDKQNTEFLAGTMVDPGSGATAVFLEASRRLGENWKLSVESRAYMDYPASDPGAALRKDDYLQLGLVWYF